MFSRYVIIMDHVILSVISSSSLVSNIKCLNLLIPYLMYCPTSYSTLTRTIWNDLWLYYCILQLKQVRSTIHRGPSLRLLFKNARDRMPYASTVCMHRITVFLLFRLPCHIMHKIFTVPTLCIMSIWHCIGQYKSNAIADGLSAQIMFSLIRCTLIWNEIHNYDETAVKYHNIEPKY
jgi:hypothetical protein